MDGYPYPSTLLAKCILLTLKIGRSAGNADCQKWAPLRIPGSQQAERWSNGLFRLLTDRSRPNPVGRGCVCNVSSMMICDLFPPFGGCRLRRKKYQIVSDEQFSIQSVQFFVFSSDDLSEEPHMKKSGVRCVL